MRLAQHYTFYLTQYFFLSTIRFTQFSTICFTQHYKFYSASRVILSSLCVSLSTMLFTQHCKFYSAQYVLFSTISFNMMYIDCKIHDPLIFCGVYISKVLTFEPVHNISNNVVCATSKGSDQPAHTRSLIRAFASRLSIL